MGLTGDTLQVCMEPTNKKGRFAVADKKKFYNYHIMKKVKWTLCKNNILFITMSRQAGQWYCYSKKSVTHDDEEGIIIVHTAIYSSEKSYMHFKENLM